ncbi:hypothetical protein Sjap_023607 [Stephania japonica]|uniref:Condensin complex subunit 1 C-terminal domain-containing protein n=1 Tax=Stephania japonica TaxID=461633 RepID=A0AAP0EBX3_9MAGN
MYARLRDPSPSVRKNAVLVLSHPILNDMMKDWLTPYTLYADAKQWEYISYCLSQLSFTEKGMKKLMESFKIYQHVLCEDSVMENFKNIIGKGKKFTKPELKSCIEEFEEKLNAFHADKRKNKRQLL